jgi:two-component sensor histidine kinase
MPDVAFAPISLLIPGGPDSARLARRTVLERVGPRLDSETAYSVGLVISELVTNSVVHAGVGPGRYLRVSVGAVKDRLLVAVSDRGSETVPRLREAAAGDAATGLGLRVVDRIARSWGVARDGTGRTQVWCELALASVSAPDGNGRLPEEDTVRAPAR